MAELFGGDRIAYDRTSGCSTALGWRPTKSGDYSWKRNAEQLKKPADPEDLAYLQGPSQGATHETVTFLLTASLVAALQAQDWAEQVRATAKAHLDSLCSPGFPHRVWGYVQDGDAKAAKTSPPPIQARWPQTPGKDHFQPSRSREQLPDSIGVSGMDAPCAPHRLPCGPQPSPASHGTLPLVHIGPEDLLTSRNAGHDHGRTGGNAACIHLPGHPPSMTPLHAMRTDA